MDYTLFFIEFFCTVFVLTVVAVSVSLCLFSFSGFIHKIFNKNSNSEDKNK